MDVKFIAFSCYPVLSIKRAREFYESVLGLVPTSVWVEDDENGMIEYGIGDGTLAIGAGAVNFKTGEGGGGATVAIEVGDIDKMVERLKAKDCRFLMEIQETPVCYMALIADPDGNKIMIHSKKTQEQLTQMGQQSSQSKPVAEDQQGTQSQPVLIDPQTTQSQPVVQERQA
jgi:predicted enzyme related to lactoylglutathione lyase